MHLNTVLIIIDAVLPLTLRRHNYSRVGADSVSEQHARKAMLYTVE